MDSTAHPTAHHPVVQWSLVLLLAMGPVVASSQLVINEACSKNVASVADGEDNFPDWIELHNAGTGPVDLSGLYLSDDPMVPLKWALPDEPIDAGGYLLLFQGDENDGRHFDFKLSQDGETIALSHSSGALLDSLRVPFLRADHSFGRAGSPSGYFISPTPGAPNTTTSYAGYAPSPTMDRSAGFYGSAISVNVHVADGLTVRYTLDGSEPGSASAEPGSPITFYQTGTLKAKAWGDQLIPSLTAVATYFINEHTELPTISLSTHPDSLFHDTFGLYMPGPQADTAYPYYGANFWDERGMAIHFEYFDENGIRAVDQELELRIHGGRVSRTKAQRPLRLTARDAYGDDLIRYPFFPERPEAQAFKRIILRNSGADWCLAHYRDGLFHQVSLHNGLDIDELGFRPAVVFINGQYWGILNIRDRIDEDHLALNYGADRDDLLIMEEENLPIQGDTVHFHDLKEYIHTHDLNDPAHWAHVDSLLDIPSCIDYFALEMFAGNADWPSNNLKYWKPSITEGKWRYLMYDMDATMNIVGWIPNDFDMFYWVFVHRTGYVHAEIFRSLLTRVEFKRGFLNRLADLMNTSLSTERLNAASERIKGSIAGEVGRHFQRWGIAISTWHQHADELIPSFAQERPDIMRQDAVDWFGLPGTSVLLFDVFPPEAGTIRINTIEPPPPFTGTYFNGNDIDITAMPADGFTFDHWTYGPEAGLRSTDPHLRRSFVEDGTITAWFGHPEGRLVALPNPCVDHVDISLTAGEEGTTELLLWDLHGRTVHRSMHAVGPGVNAIHLDLPQVGSGVYILEARTGSDHRKLRVVKLSP